MITFIKPHPTEKVEYTVLTTPLQLSSAFHFHVAKEDKAYGFLKDLFKLLCHDYVIAMGVDYGDIQCPAKRIRRGRGSSYTDTLSKLNELIEVMRSTRPGDYLFLRFRFGTMLHFEYGTYSKAEMPSIREMTINKFMIRNGMM